MSKSEVNNSKVQTAQALRFWIREDGQLMARVSASASAFELSPEILVYCCEVNRKGKQIGAALLRERLDNLAKESPRADEINEIHESLIQEGVLHTTKMSSVVSAPVGFADPWIQWAMLADKQRVNTYLAALDDHIENKRTVLLDVGAGTGLLSLFALSRGAKSAHAIEESAIAQEIPKFAKALKLPLPEVISSHSEDAQLPKGISLVVSELLGNDPFQKGCFPLCSELRKNFQRTSQTIFLTPWKSFAKSSISKKAMFASASFHLQRDAHDTADFRSRFLAASRSVLKLEELSFPLSLLPHQFERRSSVARLMKVPLSPPDPKKIENSSLSYK